MTDPHATGSHAAKPDPVTTSAWQQSAEWQDVLAWTATGALKAAWTEMASVAVEADRVHLATMIEARLASTWVNPTLQAEILELIRATHNLGEER